MKPLVQRGVGSRTNRQVRKFFNKPNKRIVGLDYIDMSNDKQRNVVAESWLFVQRCDTFACNSDSKD